MDIASPTPAERDVERHLAREWQLFQLVESGTAECGSLTWDTSRPIVVLGRSNRASEHVDEDACRQDDVRVVRRASGGGAVVLGPGCLNYAIVLSVVSRPELADVAASFRIILDQIAIAVALPGLHIEGMTDLVLEGRKVGGNAQRRGRRALLHHGTLFVRLRSCPRDALSQRACPSAFVPRGSSASPVPREPAALRGVD